MRLYFLLFSILILNVSSFAGNNGKPKNIIIMIGDGMGLSYVSSSILTNVNSSFRRFNTIGLSVTCSADNLITDSGAGATALSTGYRTNNHFIAVDANGNTLETILEYVKKNDLATGIVATSSVTHATPASFASHINDRSKEFEIADQLSESNLDVAIGGGMGFFLPKNKNGNRLDNKNLVDEIKKRDYLIFENVDSLLNYSGTDKYFALLEETSLLPAAQRKYSLADLTEAAIRRLKMNEKGFVLMVEGSQIDWAGHANSQKQVMAELEDFNKAINSALDFAKEDENTLVLVTADHETGGLAITGGKKDGSSIDLGFVSKSHTGATVGIFAFGPGEEKFRGVLDNYQIGRNLFLFFNSSITWK